MSDASVADALRSSARLVVVEAPAGCGKTFQGAEYAREIAGKIGDGRVLILTHTHAACDVFAARTSKTAGRVDVRTIDSLIGQIASTYHLALGLPSDTGTYARTRKDGYSELATRVAGLLRASPMIARSLAHRYPVVICDEHQDTSADQHAVTMACHKGGASIRIFADPMQRIYGGKKKKTEIEADNQRWEILKQKAEVFDKLDQPHRWSDGSSALGQWILEARTALRVGGQVDLRGTLPRGVSIIVAENQSPKHGGYSLAKGDGRPIYSLVNSTNSLLVLAAQNATVDALHTFFGRRLPIWEGHLRDSLSALVGAVKNHRGHAVNIVHSALAFLSHVATGFSPSAYGNILLTEVSGGCVGKRTGKPATLQALGRLILDHPDHKGVAKMLFRINELREADPAFQAVKVDYRREFWDAVRLGQYEDADEGFAEISRRRIYARPSLPDKAISTVHKAKGLECSDVLIMPCDTQHFGDSPAARCRLYVAMSRAKRSLTFVASRQKPSPLVAL